MGNYEENFFSDLLVKKEDGTIIIIKSLAHLQQKIVLKEFVSSDSFSKNGKEWEKLSTIDLLEPFFKLVATIPDAENEIKKKEAAEKEKLAKAEAEKKALAEAAEKERIAKAETEKKALAEASEKERIAKTEAEKKAIAEAAEKERLAKIEKEKNIAEIAEKARLAKLEAEKKAAAGQEKKTKAPVKNDDSEFDPSFFDDEDIPKKRTGFKLILVLIILAAACFAVYFFYFNKTEEKRIVAVREEPVPAPKEEPVPSEPEKPAAEPVKNETPAEIQKTQEPAVEKEPAAKKEPAPKKQQESIGALCKKGWQTLDKGDNNKAVEIFRKALSMNANHADAHLGLGEALNAAGKKGEAKKHYQKYLELKPDAEDRLEIESILSNL